MSVIDNLPPTSPVGGNSFPPGTRFTAQVSPGGVISVKVTRPESESGEPVQTQTGATR